MKSLMLRGCVVLGIMGVLAASGAIHAGEWNGNANFLLGSKWLDDDDWGDLDSHDEFAAMISFGREEWPVQVAIDVVSSWDERTWLDYVPDASTVEFDFGVRKVWEHGRARPFVGGGVAVIHGEVDTFLPGGLFGRDDEGVGFWVDGGVFWRLGKHFNLGFEARRSTADITIDGTGRDAGGTHVGLILGYGW